MYICFIPLPGSNAVCCSEVAANSVSEMIVVADDGQIPPKHLPWDTDDCSDHSTNDPQEESFYNGLEIIVPNYRMPQMPPTIWHNKNPLAMPSDFSPAITNSASINTSGKDAGMIYDYNCDTLCPCR